MSFILIVDDQEMNREFLLTLLSYGEHQLQVAIDGKDALEKAKKEKPILVITDLFMPIMNGYDLAQNMRNDPNLNDVPIIFYTATYRLEEARLLADSCNVRWVLTKPCDPEIILETINNALLSVNKTLNLKKALPKQLINENNLIRIHKSQTSINLSDQLSQHLKKTKPIKTMLEVLLQNTNVDNQLLIKKNTIDDFLANIAQLYQFNNQLFALTTLNLDLISEKDKNKLVK